MKAKRRLRLLSLTAIRQAVACVALLGVCVTPIESLIPDVHDGDAKVVAEGAEGTTDLSSSHSPKPGDESSPSGEHHPFHMDHCSHAHSFGPGSACSTDFRNGMESGPIDLLRTAPASVSLQPQQRPPIA